MIYRRLEMLALMLFALLTTALALYGCGGFPASQAFPSSILSRDEASPVVPHSNGSSFLYYLYQGDSAISKIRLSDGKNFRRRAYGVDDGISLASDANGHLYEVSYDGVGSSLVEINQNLKVTRTIDLPYGFATAVTVDGHGLTYVAWIPKNRQIAIDVFSREASGNATPLRSISGGQTGLQVPLAVAVDTGGRVYVADVGTNQIFIYPPHANGDVPPVQVIGGDQTGLIRPCSLTLGADGNIYVSNQLTGSTGGYDVLVFPMSGNGNIAPLRVLQTGNYGYAITLDGTGQLYAGLGFEGGQREPTFEIFAAGASGQDKPVGSLDGIKGATPASAVLEFPWYQP